MIAIDETTFLGERKEISGKVEIGLCGADLPFLKQLGSHAVRFASAKGAACELHFYDCAEVLLKDTFLQLDLLFVSGDMCNPGSWDNLNVLLCKRRIGRVIFLDVPDQRLQCSDRPQPLISPKFESKSSCLFHISHYLNQILLEKEKRLPVPGISKYPDCVVRMQDLLYVEAESNYIKVHADSTVMLAETLKKFEEQHTSLPLVRIHRSFLVNLLQVREIGNTVTFLHSDEVLPVSRTYRKTARMRFLDYQLRKNA